MQVLKDEQQRGELGEYPQDADEQPMPSRQHVAGAVVIDQPAHVIPQGSDERPERECRSDERSGLTGEDVHVVGTCLGGDILD